MKFSSTSTYIATEELQMAVNAAVILERPLLIKGEPGTGKTMLAEEIASSLGLKIITWYVKSTTKAQQGLYEYDAVSRLRDSQLGDDRVHDINNYIEKGKLLKLLYPQEKLLVDGCHSDTSAKTKFSHYFVTFQDPNFDISDPDTSTSISFFLSPERG